MIPSPSPDRPRLAHGLIWLAAGLGVPSAVFSLMAPGSAPGAAGSDYVAVYSLGAMRAVSSDGLALAWFGTLLGLLLLERRGRASQWPDRLLRAWSVLGLAFALWHVSTLMKLADRISCPSCLVTHLAIAAISVTLIATPRSAEVRPSSRGRVLIQLGSAVALLGLAGWGVIAWHRGRLGFLRPPPKARIADPDAWLAAQPRPGTEPLASTGRVTVVVFNDYQCPFCRRAYATHLSVFEELSRLGVPLSVVAADYPLDPECNPAVRRELHPLACEAAVAVRLSSRRGRGRAMTEWLFANGPTLSLDGLRQASAQVGLVEDFDGEYADGLREVRASIELARRLGVRETPSVFVDGVRIPSGTGPETLKALVRAEARRQANGGSLAPE